MYFMLGGFIFISLLISGLAMSEKGHLKNLLKAPAKLTGSRIPAWYMAVLVALPMWLIFSWVTWPRYAAGFIRRMRRTLASVRA